MSDTLVAAVMRARVWPAGSGARVTLLKAAGQLATKRDEEIKDVGALLARQWQWLEEKGSPGLDDPEGNGDRYEDGMRRYLLTLANYEDLCDGLVQARQEMNSLGRAA